MTARVFLILVIGILVGGPLSFLWYAFDENYFWIPAAFVVWLAALRLPEWGERRTAPYGTRRRNRRR